MDSLSSYHNTFKDLATRHLDILHSEEEMHFARINISKHPIIGAEDLKEFFNSISKKLKTPFVLSAAPEYQNSNDQDNAQQIVMGEFFVMDRSERGDYDDKQSIMEKCQGICEDFISDLFRQFEEDETKGMIDYDSLNIEFVNNVTTNGYAGAKCYFNIKLFTPSKFINKENRFNP